MTAPPTFRLAAAAGRLEAFGDDTGDGAAPSSRGALDAVLGAQAGFSWRSGDPAPYRVSWLPMLAWAPGGSRVHNHWAPGGSLAKWDRAHGTGSRDYQLSHRYRSLSQLRDSLLGRNGQWDATNAGHCNQVAMSAFFVDPRRSVDVRVDVPPTPPGLRATLRHAIRDAGVIEFTAQDIRGLMALCMDDLVVPGSYRYVGWRDQLSVPDPRPNDPRTDPQEPYPLEVIRDVCRRWGADVVEQNTAQGKKTLVLLDRNSGQRLDNVAYDGGSVEVLGAPPPNTDLSSVPEGGAVRFVRVRFTRANQPEHDIDICAWLHADERGEVTSGWIQPRPSFRERVVQALTGRPPRPKNPDFFWLPEFKPGVLEGRPWTGFADSTNPHVDMFRVWMLHQRSLGHDVSDVAQRYPEEVARHEEILRARGRDVGAFRADLGLTTVADAFDALAG